MKKTLLLVILLTILSGCVSREENVTSTSTVVTSVSTVVTSVIPPRTLEFKTISKGFYSGYTKKANLLVNDEEEWTRLLQRVTANRVQGIKIQTVDFSRYSVIAVFLGEKNTGGYDITIQKIERDDVVRVYLIKKYPSPGDIVTQAFTQPYHIVRTEKLDDVVFVETTVGEAPRMSVKECSADGDCLVTGCSGQVCSSKKAITTCEWMPEYECYRKAKCSCVNGNCQWVKGVEFNRCMEGKTAKEF